jgi:hypothetical protein
MQIGLSAIRLAVSDKNQVALKSTSIDFVQLNRSVQPGDKIGLEETHRLTAGRKGLTEVDRSKNEVEVVHPEHSKIPEPKKSMMPGRVSVSLWAEWVIIVIGNEFRASRTPDHPKRPRQHIRAPPDPEPVGLVPADCLEEHDVEPNKRWARQRRESVFDLAEPAAKECPPSKRSCWRILQ